MQLTNLQLYNYKNYASAELSMHAKINVFVGENGAGKTNVLDAIYYLSFCKSNFQALDKNCIKHDETGFRIHGKYQVGTSKLSVAIKLPQGKKKEVVKNKKKYKSLSEHIGIIPLVIICPDDISAIIEGSEARRRLMDICLCQIDKVYLRHLIVFQRVLKQRNAYLKSIEPFQVDHGVLDSFDDQIIPLSTYICERRNALTKELKPFLQRTYEAISSQKEAVEIEYKSEILDQDPGEMIKSHRSDDIRMRRTTKGVHRDDYVLKLDSYTAKKFGSQGQIKSVIISLKMAQALFLSQKKDQKPMLLLDDIFDKLDGKRVKSLLELGLTKDFGQLFITDTEPKRISDILDELNLDYNCFEVNNGSIAKI